MRYLAAIALLIGTASSAFAQSSPGFTNGPGPLTASALNGAFQNKADAANPTITVGATIGSGSQNAIKIIPGATTSTAATISVSGTGGITLVGLPILHGISTGNPSMPPFFIGNGAGAAFPIGTSDPYGTIGIGANALQNLTSLGTETTAVGALAAQMAVSTPRLSAFGMHSCGAEATQPDDSCFGDDAGRDVVSQLGGVTTIGSSAAHDGFPGWGLTSVGAYAASGNAANILIGGSVTAGDIITVTLSASLGRYTLIGVPHTTNYTVVSGDTLASIATNIAAALNGVVTDQNGLPLTVQSYPTPDSLGLIHFDFPGSSAHGWKMTVASSTNTGGTETVAVGGPSAYTHSTIGGFNSALGLGAGALDSITTWGFGDGVGNRTGYNLALFGNGTGASITTADSMSLFGAFQLADQVQTGNDVVAAGTNTLHNATRLTDVVAIGDGVAFHATNLNNDLLLGTGVGFTTLATGSGVIMIGSGAQTVDTPLANTSNYINIENILTVTGTATPSTSVASFAGFLNVVTGYQANGTAGVTCTGSPTASFASAGGIVTHC